MSNESAETASNSLRFLEASGENVAFGDRVRLIERRIRVDRLRDALNAHYLLLISVLHDDFMVERLLVLQNKRKRGELMADCGEKSIRVSDCWPNE